MGDEILADGMELAEVGTGNGGCKVAIHLVCGPSVFSTGSHTKPFSKLWKRASQSTLSKKCMSAACFCEGLACKKRSQMPENQVGGKFLASPVLASPET
jgi:hypothetical protein